MHNLVLLLSKDNVFNKNNDKFMPEFIFSKMQNQIYNIELITKTNGKLSERFLVFDL